MGELEPTSDADKPAGLAITVERSEGAAAVVIVTGEIDLETSPELSAVLAGLDPPGDVDVDLASVTYIDSTGLRALLTARDAAIEAGGTLRVSATSSIVARLIEITGCDELLRR
jgi:anti-anti-sigma factor